MLETISDINIANVGSSANKIWSELKGRGEVEVEV
jgi:hypothetical protein